MKTAFKVNAQHISRVLAEPFSGLLPPEEIPVEEFTKRITLNNPMTSGPVMYRPDKAPYQTEILECFTGTAVQIVAFVAPSRAGKSWLALPLLSHTALCSTMNIMIMGPTHDMADKFCKEDLAEFIESNPWFASQIRQGRSHNTLRNKKFKNGVTMSVIGPSAPSMAGVNRGMVAGLDYDRNELNIGREGSAFSQMKMRTKAYGRRKKMYFESSPSKLPAEISKFEPDTPHQAPPYPGIFALYNQGDRRWWYWQCLNDQCREWFAAHRRHMKYADEGTPNERAATAVMVCPHCKREYTHDGDPENGVPGKYELNLGGRWVPDGQYLDKDGNLHGEMANPPMPGMETTRSYWLFGPAASLGKETWKDMVLDLILAEEKFRDTGDYGDYINKINSDWAEYWVPPHLLNAKSWEVFRERAVDYPKGLVPDEALYLIATVDSQEKSWVLQVQAMGPEGRMWCIDRRRIYKSERPVMAVDKDGNEFHVLDDKGVPKMEPVLPGRYPEDWKILERELAALKYPLEDGSGYLVPAIIGVDSGGAVSTTANSYAWWRTIGSFGMPRSRVILLKGDAKAKNLAEIRKPDGTKRNDRAAGNRGDVPVMFISSNQVKDILASNLDRQVEGPGFVYLPLWWHKRYFQELASERRHGDGWVPTRERNEAWDLFAYTVALNMSDLFQADRIDWHSDHLPNWARRGRDNPFLIPNAPARAAAGTASVEPEPEPEPYLSLEELGADLEG